MLVLAIDTATPVLVVGVGRVDGTVSTLAERRVPTARGHAEVLSGLALDCLAEADVARSDLDAVVVGCGPGPFTGLRVGMASAAAFADALDLRAVGVCSLDAIVAGTDVARRGTTLAVTDARRREIYWARYVDGVRTDGPAVQAPATLADDLDHPDTVVGSPDHAGLIGLTAEPDTEAPTVAGLIAAARDALVDDHEPEPLVPLYLRRPDAVERARP
ncbi:tRNA (adenosine(37)-N6)-threonylcarbamoyltransferase complex dimerization subunit type 1 TsaB [uncultured Williamsia sp.]|uniref:tRNA (adenosine(37)-N6)-threonylcarbamoyltransferase complex dimerization subunit type 1 TsaB n=1 Tax=uncultured Williamsia sp. TaxID=259311 RepID=UPI00261F6794|nr:tRNA (adenosine(37)-N6)-threonylcarbamoyltransferase complex dimerization subunit type 1 TsaB [uncultured Williamsia sp.]